MKMIRTMRGEMIDMAALAAQNASVVALGNANMNARGDIVDKSGHVIKSREVVVQEYYNSNPKAVTQTVSLKNLGDEVLTPAEVIAKLEEAAKEKGEEIPTKPATKPKRKISDD